jgi:hypothetical protein
LNTIGWVEIVDKPKKNKTREEYYQEYLESKARNETEVSLVTCPICKNCKAYRVRINNRTFIYVTQCRKIKIIENQKDPDDNWLIDYDDFLNYRGRKLEEYF